jgi:Helix-turn-helix domain
MSGEAGNPQTGLEIGGTLERAREERALSLQQVEEATKIRSRYLRDLENENFDVLPAVYVLGSLKTYAEYLGLDGAALTAELKRRWAFPRAEREGIREESPAGGLRAFVGRFIGIGDTAEDEAGAVPDPVHSPRLYVSLGVVVIFVIATTLASDLGVEDQQPVSQLREPKVSRFPAMLVLAANVPVIEPDNGSGNTEDRPEGRAGIPAKNDKIGAEGGGRTKDASRTARVPSAVANVPESVSAVSASPTTSPASPGSAPAVATPPAAPRPSGAGSELGAKEESRITETGTTRAAGSVRIQRTLPPAEREAPSPRYPARPQVLGQDEGAHTLRVVTIQRSSQGPFERPH